MEIQVRGEILSYDGTTQSGLISGDDGARYNFTAAALQSPAVPAAGLRVDFVPEADAATQILILAGAPSTVGVAGGLSAPTATGAGFDFTSAMFSFNGRLRRSHFWIGFLIIFGASLVLGWIPFLGGLISIALIWPNLAISVKRLHDMGKSGWLIAIPFGVNIILTFIAFGIMISNVIANGGTADYYEDNPEAALAVMGPAIGLIGLAGLVSLGFLLWIGLVDSQKGENRFGPNPKGE
ncbi:uncharacterized membrane protein YhaH (DUF805 family) [Brevundimonas mediterranea]|jgi:uncharacterized membrane protein YhaH (DUF805 family)|uniref:Uncharacterized membrane protein YhaH (DUF805 family) n=1 Tax=Brevundimonas mediterranea TaxID=74329 RepID=A0A7W6A2D7_9CAUL|nr:DUF805 domain-containing protein [Brevundimonas mediterranea]MBB3871983.1 uncharacterized membrane protein YhaH (DUF805 family) [Brevundimonas mediterranea]